MGTIWPKPPSERRRWTRKDSLRVIMIELGWFTQAELAVAWVREHGYEWPRLLRTSRDIRSEEYNLWRERVRESGKGKGLTEFCFLPQGLPEESEKVLSELAQGSLNLEGDIRGPEGGGPR